MVSVTTATTSVVVTGTAATAAAPKWPRSTAKIVCVVTTRLSARAALDSSNPTPPAHSKTPSARRQCGSHNSHALRNAFKQNVVHFLTTGNLGVGCSIVSAATL